MSKTSTPSKKSSEAGSSAEINEESMLEPRAHVIQNILNYSKSLKIQKSKSVGHIEIISN
jgi:hypothetical protein